MGHNDSAPLFIGWERRKTKREVGWKTNGKFLLRDLFLFILFIFFFQTTVEKNLIYLHDEYEFVTEPHDLKPSGMRLTARLN